MKGGGIGGEEGSDDPYLLLWSLCERGDVDGLENLLDVELNLYLDQQRETGTVHSAQCRGPWPRFLFVCFGLLVCSLLVSHPAGCGVQMATRPS